MAIGAVGGGGAVQAPQAAAAAPAAGAAPDAGTGAQEIDDNMIAQAAGGTIMGLAQDAMGEAQKIESKNMQRNKEALAELKKEV